MKSGRERWLATLFDMFQKGIVGDGLVLTSMFDIQGYQKGI